MAVSNSICLRSRAPLRVAAQQPIPPPPRRPINSHVHTPLFRKSPLPGNRTATAVSSSNEDERMEAMEDRLNEAMTAMNAEIEASIGTAVHDAMELELESVQGTVADAVGQALDSRPETLDLRANLNTLVALTGIVLFERGVWTAWDVFFGDDFWSEISSIGLGLSIMLAIRVFDIPLAEWKRPSVAE